MDARTITFYNRHAAELSRRYDTADTSRLQKFLHKHLPRGGRILEFGCGSGRDAAFLLAQDYKVTATDASPAMLKMAQLLRPELDGHLAQASVPLPRAHPFLRYRFDGITAVALIMHLNDRQLQKFAAQCQQLLAPGAVLIVSTSTHRAGLKTRRDQGGRLFFERPVHRACAFFEQAGLQHVASNKSADAYGRPIQWSTLAFKRDPHCRGEP